jgi:hypothetical protein
VIAIVMTRSEGDLGSALTARVIATALGSRLATAATCVVADTTPATFRFDVGLPLITRRDLAAAARRCSVCWLQDDQSDTAGRDTAHRLGGVIPLVVCGGDGAGAPGTIHADGRLLRDLAPAVDHRAMTIRLRFLTQVGIVPEGPFDLHLARNGTSGLDRQRDLVTVAYGAEPATNGGVPVLPTALSTEDVIALVRAARTVQVDDAAMRSRLASIGRVQTVSANGSTARAELGGPFLSWDAIAARVAASRTRR